MTTLHAHDDDLPPRRPRVGRRRRRSAALLVASALGASSLGLVPGEPASAAITTVPITSRVSVGLGGAQGPSPTIYGPLIDQTGRFVVFNSSFPFVAADTNGTTDVYRKDRITGIAERVSFDGAGLQFSGLHATACAMSPDGRWIAFQTSDNAAGFKPTEQTYLRDAVEGTTTLVSTGPNGPANGLAGSTRCAVSGNGTRVAFVSSATNLGGGGDAVADVFVRQVDAGTTIHIARSTGGAEANSESGSPAISANGDVVAFSSTATNLVAGDTNGQRDIFVRVISTGTTQRVSTTAGGAQTVGDAQSPSISATGRYVAFSTDAPDVVAGDGNGATDVFRKDRQTGAVVRASVKAGSGQEGNADSHSPAITADGRYVAFTSDATNLYPVDVNGATDTFRRDLDLERTDLASRVWNGVSPGNADSWYGPAISADGRVVAFVSTATNLVAGDTNGQRDLFVRDFALDIAPFGSAKAFATQQLKDFGTPAPSATQVGAATDQLLQGIASPDASIVARSRNPWWAGKRPPLVRLYWAYFLRAPDLGGLKYWVGQLEGGKALAKVAAQFSLSPEFQNTYGSKTNEQFVTLIYQNIFERDPDAGGLAFWTAKLDAKQKTRGDVMVAFSESSEGKRLLAPQVDTIAIYLGMLGSMPPAGAFADLVSDLKDGAPAEIVAAHVRTLPAYAARVTA